MKIVRYWDSASDKPFYGVVEGDSVVQIEGNPYGEIKLTKSVRPLSGLRLLPPCEPTKIVCGGLNYKGHALETNQPIPDVSVCFLKPPSSLIGHEEPIMLSKRRCTIHRRRMYTTISLATPAVTMSLPAILLVRQNTISSFRKHSTPSVRSVHGSKQISIQVLSIWFSRLTVRFVRKKTQEI
jgi:hypothetical protein